MASSSKPKSFADADQYSSLQPDGYTNLVVSKDAYPPTMYATLKPEERTWRCEQMKKATDLNSEAWELLKPVAKGHWDQEKCYNGLALFVKGMYEGQGYHFHPPDMLAGLPKVMRVVQERMPWVELGGRRVQADENPARFALRVCLTVLVQLLSTTVATGLQSPQDEAAKAELLDSALLMSTSCIDKLGGSELHEGTLGGENAAALARLATAAPGEAQRVLLSVPTPIVALYMMQVLYDIDMKKIKWVLHFVAARAAKEAYRRARSSGDPSSMSPARAAWLGHTAALVSLAPDMPQSLFLAAEARTSTTGSTPDTLAAMRKAAKAADRRGDDLVAWLAHLNVAQVLQHGGGGEAGYREDEVLEALDAAASSRGSVKRWGGTLLGDCRCRALREAVLQELEDARSLAAQQRAGAEVGAAGSCSAAAAPPLPEGWLPYTHRSKVWSVLKPRAASLRECQTCKKYGHKSMACGRCKTVWYCGRECQAADWKAGHRKDCARLAEEAAKRAAEEGPGGEED